MIIKSKVKQCIKCKDFKSLSEFSLDNRSKVGYQCYCKICVRNYQKQYYIKNKEKLLKCASDNYKEYYKNNKLKLNEKSRLWRLSNKDKVRNYDRKYHKRTYQDRKDKRRKYTKDWIVRNKDRVKLYYQNRRAKIKEVGGVITIQDWKELLEMANYKCLCCKSKENLEIDHVVPITRGGANTKENAQVLCRSCNASKGNRHNTDYR